MFYCIIVPLAWLVWHILFRIRVVGKENLIRDGSFIIAPNHISAIDPVFVVIARFWGRRMLILGKEELFAIHPVISWMFRHVGVVPVHRGKGDTEAVEKAIEYVRSGNGRSRVPGGTRTKDGNLGRLKSGVFVIASQAHAPIIPCRLIYRGGKPGLFRRCTVVFGKPIPAETLDMGDTYSMARLRECKKLLETELERLLEEHRDAQ